MCPAPRTFEAGLPVRAPCSLNKGRKPAILRGLCSTNFPESLPPHCASWPVVASSLRMLSAKGLREVRRILLEADVSFELTREFLERVQARAIGVLQIKDVRPGHQLVKIVYDELVTLLGEKSAPIAFASVPPTIILAGRAAGIRQDHHRGQAREAAQAGAEGAVPRRGRRLSSRRRRAAGDAGRAGGRRRVPGAGRKGRGEARTGRHRRGGEGTRAHRHRRHRRPAADRRRDDGRAAPPQGRGVTSRNPARRRRHDRPGRGPDRARAFTTPSASPASS